jgi:hypothetical protein
MKADLLQLEHLPVIIVMAVISVCTLQKMGTGGFRDQ